MCAQYIIKANAEVLFRQMHLSPPQRPTTLAWNERIYPHSLAPVVVQGQSGARVLYPMQYSLIPRWSKSSTIKFATYNARSEMLADRPTWRESFYHRRCLVPLHGFFEPIYEGDYAGFMVEFSQADGHLLVAAGLWDRWRHPETGGELFSFAIVTAPASAWVASVGHDRMPVFLREDVWDLWLDRRLQQREQIFSLLNERQEWLLSATQDRPLRSSVKRATQK